MKHVFIILAACLCAFCARAQSYTRLIATAQYRYLSSGFKPNDSMTMMYTGSNSFDSATNDWQYDSSKSLVYNTTATQWEDKGRTYKVIQNGHVVSDLRRVFTTVWKDDQKTTYTYSGNLITAVLWETNSGTGLQNDRRRTSTYNSDNLETTAFFEKWNGTGWENDQLILTHYNNNKQSDTGIVQIWNGQWQNLFKFISIYTGTQLTTDITQTDFMGNWMNDSRATYIYDANGDQVSFLYDSWGGSSWEPDIKFTRTFNTTHDKLSNESAIWDGSAWKNSDRQNYTYNQAHYKLTEDGQYWNNSSNQWVYLPGNSNKTYYYYEQQPNSVKTVTSAATAMQLFPVPATHTVNMMLDLQQPQVIAVFVLDMSGKLLKHWSEQAGKHYQKAIDVSGLPAGKYIIHVTGSTEQAVQAINVVH